MHDKFEKNVFLNPSVADEYDNYYHTETGTAIDRIEKQLLLPHLDKLPKRKLLELGCGTGHWTHYLTGLGFEVKAVDASPAMLNVAERKKIENAEFQLADAENLPFPDESFSAVVSVTMLEFVQNANKVLDEIYRILQPNGVFILGCLNENSELGKSKSTDPVFKNASFFTPVQMRQMLIRFGTPVLSAGVYLSPGFNILDEKGNHQDVEPAFITASVVKTNY